MARKFLFNGVALWASLYLHPPSWAWVRGGVFICVHDHVLEHLVFKKWSISYCVCYIEMGHLSLLASRDDDCVGRGVWVDVHKTLKPPTGPISQHKCQPGLYGPPCLAQVSRSGTAVPSFRAQTRESATC